MPLRDQSDSETAELIAELAAWGLVIYDGPDARLTGKGLLVHRALSCYVHEAADAAVGIVEGR